MTIKAAASTPAAPRDSHLRSGDFLDVEVSRSARDPFGNLRVEFEGSTSINRKDSGPVLNAALETGGVLGSERIKLELDISAIAVSAS